MQKKLIALAVAGLASTAAFAQSSVTVYGIADVGLSSTKSDSANTTVNGVTSGILSTSRIGFKGTEDLGNGLKAIFNLEFALAMDDSSTIGAARQKFVGLSSNYGTVVAGYLQTAGYDFAAKGLALSGSSVLSTMHNVGLASAPGNQLNISGRAMNAVAYVSPSISGLTFAYNHSFGPAATETDPSSKADLVGVDYANGPITAGAAYSRVNLVGANNTITEWGVRGGYNFGVATVQAVYQTLKDEAVSNEKDKKWGVSAAVPVSAAGTVVAEYAKSSINSVASSDSKAYTLAYTHGLSKRTTAYAGYTVRNPEGGDNNTKVLGLGVRHSF